MHVLIAAVSRFTQLTGICRYAINHAKAIADVADMRVTLVIGRWQEAYYRASVDGADVQLAIADCSNSSLARNRWYMRHLPAIGDEMQADIVHLAYPVPGRHSNYAMPVVATIHDLYPYDLPNNFGFPNALFNRMFQKQCVRESDVLVCVSEFTRERLLHHFPKTRRDRILVISSYSELGDVVPCAPEYLEGRRFILTVGQHRANKNIDRVIRAYSQLTGSNAAQSSLQLVVSGAMGPETQRLQLLARQLGLEDRIVFLDALSDAHLAWLYRNCELFVAASSIEGFCLPLLEACELSPRLVCSDIPVFREVAGDAAEYFLLDSDSLTAVISRSLESAPSTRLSVPRFTRSGTVRAFAQLYRRLSVADKLTPANIAS